MQLVSCLLARVRPCDQTVLAHCGRFIPSAVRSLAVCTYLYLLWVWEPLRAVTTNMVCVEPLCRSWPKLVVRHTTTVQARVQRLSLRARTSGQAPPSGGLCARIHLGVGAHLWCVRLPFAVRFYYFLAFELTTLLPLIAP